MSMAGCGFGALKVCVVGDPGVGKTSLVRCFSEGRFEEPYLSTVGASVRTATVGFTPPGFARPVFRKLALWDLTGHCGAFSAAQYMRGARAVLAVADATRPETQAGLAKWVERAQSAGSARGDGTAGPAIPIVLVVNKCDLAGPAPDIGAVKEVSARTGRPYRLVSARSQRNVPAAFSDLVGLVVRPWSALEARRPGPLCPPWPAGPAPAPERWDFSAGFWPGDPGTGGWPDPHGACVVGR
jgi:small GTP-binding protein